MDLIDRKALLERMRENAAFATSYKPYMTKEDIAFRVLKDAKEQALRFVEDAPTIEAVPVVHGYWTLRGYFKGLKLLECSVCGKRSIGHRNYCGECGAKMNGKWE